MRTISSSIAAVLMLVAGQSWAADIERGRQLYENHCTSCHADIVHLRDKKITRTLDDVRHQIARWKGVLNLDWTAAEMEDVLQFLNDNYYQFPQPK
ncbi:MAG: hypothetical protein U1F68_09915 [Gammaproteobacteria bacterium]